MSEEFSVEVADGDIVVIIGAFRAAYYKTPNDPQLFLRYRTQTKDHALMAKAWHAANDKARELGWIV